jgi:hypothetical protein
MTFLNCSRLSYRFQLEDGSTVIIFVRSSTRVLGIGETALVKRIGISKRAIRLVMNVLILGPSIACGVAGAVDCAIVTTESSDPLRQCWSREREK